MTEGKPSHAAATADIRFRILNWIGIVDQLASTRANALLAPCGLTLPQFSVLNHFTWRGQDGLTVGQVAAAMQQQQPGVTKLLQKLEGAALLRSAPNPEDGRSRLFHLSEAGRAIHHDAVERLSAALVEPFEGWSEAELETCLALLDRLKGRLDAGR